MDIINYITMQAGASPLDIVEIPLSKAKIGLLLLGALLFVLAGIYLVDKPTIFNMNPLLIKISGYTGIIVFAVITLFIINKLFDPKPGFVIDDNGIVDNSSVFAIGFIPWEDISDISVLTVRRQKIIMIKVTDPDGYIRRQPNAMGRRAASLNYRLFGSPVQVSANTLRISFTDLYGMITNKRQQINLNGD